MATATPGRRMPSSSSNIPRVAPSPSAAAMSRTTSASSNASTNACVELRSSSKANPIRSPDEESTQSDNWISQLRAQIRERQRPELEKKLSQIEEKYLQQREKAMLNPVNLEGRLQRLEDYRREKRFEIEEAFRTEMEDEINTEKAIRASAGEDVELSEDEELVRTQRQILEQIEKDAQRRAQQASLADTSPTTPTHAGASGAPQARRATSTRSVSSQRSFDQGITPLRRGSGPDSLASDLFSNRSTNFGWETGSPEMYEEWDQSDLPPVSEEHTDPGEDRDDNEHDYKDDDGSESEDDYGTLSDDNVSYVGTFMQYAETPQKSNSRPIGGRHSERSRAGSIGKTPPLLAQYGPSAYPPSSVTTPVRHQSSRSNLSQSHQFWKPVSTEQMRTNTGPISIPSRQSAGTIPRRQPSINISDSSRREKVKRDEAEREWEDHDSSRSRTRSGSASGAAALSAMPGTSASPRSSASGAASSQPLPKSQTAQTSTPKRWMPGESQQRTPAPPVASDIHANGGQAAIPYGPYRQRNNSETSSGIGGRSSSPARRPSIPHAYSHSPSPKPTGSLPVPASGISASRRSPSFLTESPPTLPMAVPTRANTASRASVTGSFSNSPYVPAPGSSLGGSVSNRSASPPPRVIFLERPSELVEPEPRPPTTAPSFLGGGKSKGITRQGKSHAPKVEKEDDMDWELGAKSAGQRTPGGSRPASALSGRMAQEKERERAEAEKGKTEKVEEEREEELTSAAAMNQTKAKGKKGKKKNLGKTVTQQQQSSKQTKAQLDDAKPDPSDSAADAEAQRLKEQQQREKDQRLLDEKRAMEEAFTIKAKELEDKLNQEAQLRQQREKEVQALRDQLISHEQRDAARKAKEDAQMADAVRDLQCARDAEIALRKELEEHKDHWKEHLEAQKRKEKELQARVEELKREQRRLQEENRRREEREREAEERRKEEEENRKREEKLRKEQEAIERRAKEAEMMQQERERKAKEAELERRREEVEKQMAELRKREEELRRREEEALRAEEERKKAEEERRRKAEEEAAAAANQEAEEEEEDDDDDDDDDDDEEEEEEEEEVEEDGEEDGEEDEEVEDETDSEEARLEAERLAAEREAAEKARRVDEERKERMKRLEDARRRELERRREREEAERKERERKEREEQEHRRMADEIAAREEINRRDVEERDRAKRYEQRERERPKRYEAPRAAFSHSQRGTDEDFQDNFVKPDTIEEQRQLYDYYSSSARKQSSAGAAAYGANWNGTNFPGKTPTAASSAPSNVSHRSNTSNTSSSTAASDFSRASATSSATSAHSGASSSGGTARPTLMPKGTGNRKAAAGSGSFGGPGISPQSGSYTHSSPLSDAEWARRQEDAARKQQEAFMRENLRAEQESAARAAASAMAGAGGRAEVARLWATYESAWASLRDRPVLYFATMPWPVLKPPADPDNLTANAISAFVLSTAHSQGKSNRDRIKDQLMRWHPDKFESKWMGKVDERDKDVVRMGAGAVVRGLNELMAREANGPF